jgi:hypothetical protein
MLMLLELPSISNSTKQVINKQRHTVQESVDLVSHVFCIAVSRRAPTMNTSTSPQLHTIYREGKEKTPRSGEHKLHTAFLLGFPAQLPEQRVGVTCMHWHKRGRERESDQVIMSTADFWRNNNNNGYNGAFLVCLAAHM